jgi:hypothetical protein
VAKHQFVSLAECLNQCRVGDEVCFPATDHGGRFEAERRFGLRVRQHDLPCAILHHHKIRQGVDDGLEQLCMFGGRVVMAALTVQPRPDKGCQPHSGHGDHRKLEPQRGRVDGNRRDSGAQREGKHKPTPPTVSSVAPSVAGMMIAATATPAPKTPVATVARISAVHAAEPTTTHTGRFIAATPNCCGASPGIHDAWALPLSQKR